MTIKRLSEKKVTITLSITELNNRNISLKELQQDSKKAKKLFTDLIKESKLNSFFGNVESELFIEASTKGNNSLIITITKLETENALESYNLLSNSKVKTNNYNIFIFNDLDIIFKFINTLNNKNIFIGKNSLYYFQNKYIIIFSNYSINNTNFIKLNDLLCEFCETSKISKQYETILKEYGELLISNKAIQSLLEY